VSSCGGACSVAAWQGYVLSVGMGAMLCGW